MVGRHAPVEVTLPRWQHQKQRGALRMPRVLEVLDATLRRIEQGEIDGKRRR